MSNQNSLGETPKRTRKGNSFLYVILAISGVAIGIWMINSQFQRADNKSEIWDQSLTWPTVDGVVTDSFADTYQKFDPDGDYIMYYFARVRFDYSVDGARYSSDNLDFRASMSTDFAAAKALTNQYPRGKKVAVYYNPSNPEKSVLIPGCQGCERYPSNTALFPSCILILVCMLFLLNKLIDPFERFLGWDKSRDRP